jgi:hypothetical protein
MSWMRDTITFDRLEGNGNRNKTVKKPGELLGRDGKSIIRRPTSQP